MPYFYYGGVSLELKKEETYKNRTRLLPPPDRVTLPLSWGRGAPCRELVKTGERVLLGQKIGDGPNAVPVHASISGKVGCIQPRLCPDGMKRLSIVIENDFQNTFHPAIFRRPRPERFSREEMAAILREAGVVLMDGSPVPDWTIIDSQQDRLDTLLINGTECEPYVTADYRLLREYPEELLDGIRLLMKIYGLRQAVIAAQTHMYAATEEIEDMLPLRRSDITIKMLPARYPLGAEKQVIQAVTGRKVPPHGTAADAGCAVYTIEMALAAYRAIYHNMPVVRRIVTVSGSGIARPDNFEVPLGTLLEDIIEAAGGLPDERVRILAGGPMTGAAQKNLSVPVMRDTNAILLLSKKEAPRYQGSACLRCGRCVSVCPMRLMPVSLYRFACSDQDARLRVYHLEDCIECGCCAYACPARLPLTRAFQTKKQEFKHREQEEAQA